MIVHTGNGRAFQTGVDVTEIATDGQGMQRYQDSVVDFDLHFTAWHQQVWKPVITAVNGICCGGGFHWVADADIVIAASDAQFFDPHVSIGQVVSIEAIGLIRKMPAEAVMRMAFVGKYERMNAQRAYELGMISQIVDPPGQLREEAQALAEKIAATLRSCNTQGATVATGPGLGATYWGDGAPGHEALRRAGATKLLIAEGPSVDPRGVTRLGGLDAADAVRLNLPATLMSEAQLGLAIARGEACALLLLSLIHI